MAVITTIAWPLRLLAVGLVSAGLGTGVYFLAQAGDADDERVFVAGTATLAETPVTQTPPAATGTLPPAATATVAQPTAPPPTAVPTLPPPPPRPQTPLPPVEGFLTGGRWYTMGTWCLTFYIPDGYMFDTNIALNDPGGYMSLTLSVVTADGSTTGDYLYMRTNDGEEIARVVQSPAINPVFDQIAATFSTEC